MEGDNRARRKQAADPRSRAESANAEGIKTRASKQRSRARAMAAQVERRAETRRGEDKVAGDDVPAPLRGEGRSRDPVTRP